MAIHVLSALDPLSGLFLLLIVGMTLLLLLNLAFIGVCKLFGVKQLGLIFWWSFSLNTVLSVFMAMNNAFGPYKGMSQVLYFISPHRENGKIQPLEMIIVWTLICLLCLVLITQKKNKLFKTEDAQNTWN